MNLRSVVAAFVVVLVAVACTSQESPTDTEGTWVGTITTEGNVTTVINESGSVWGGTARLVEELSIGTDQGEAHYMLGPGRGLWDSGDPIVYADLSVPAVRIYDATGKYVGDVGRSGQGPGEYQYPFSVAVLGDGRIAVTNAESGWIDFFNGDLSYLGRWGPHHEALTAPGSRLNHSLVLGTDETLYLNYWEWPDGQDLRRGWRAVDAEGVGPVIWVPEFEFEPLLNCYDADCSLYSPVEHAPTGHYALLPSGATIGGVSDDYRFSIHYLDGSTTVVQRYWTPFELSDEEWVYWTLRERAQGIARSADWQPSWSAEVPHHKPSFERFYGARDGRILVLRNGPSRRLQDCTEDLLADDGGSFIACWESTQVLNAFDADGRYLGEIEMSGERWRAPPHVDGSRLTVAVEDEAGTIMVKRYRLVLPESDR